MLQIYKFKTVNIDKTFILTHLAPLSAFRAVSASGRSMSQDKSLVYVY